MWPTLASISNDLTLSEVAARLSSHPAVDGILAIGSTATSTLNPASDYDLVLVLNRAPLRLTVALTYLDHRLTDVIFVAAAEIEHIIAPDAVDPASLAWGPGRLVPWLNNGTVLYDRTGRLAEAQAVAASQPEAGPGEGQRFSAWFGINYNLRQNVRMAASDDPTYLTALDLRLLYCLSDLWWNYFILRGLPQRGEKAQVRYMVAQDPAYLALFRQCLAEGDRSLRFELYRALAELTVAPASGLWAADATSVQPDNGAGWQDDAPAQALAFWQELMGQDSTPKD
jgi:predicted nucleotidyltransferase